MSIEGNMATDSECLNLRKLYGDRYRIVLDPAAEYEPSGRRDPWLFIIPCKYGEIYPHGGDLLAVMVVGVYKVPEMRKLELPSHQNGDGEAVFLFTQNQFTQVAKVVKPRKRRRLSEKDRGRLAEMGGAHLFQSKKHGVQITPSVSRRVSGCKPSSGISCSGTGVSGPTAESGPQH
jgi:hypothetical protein